MVGDGPVFAAQLLHVVGDFLQRAVAVAPVGMVVQRAFELRPFEQARQFVLFRGGEFAAVLAHFGRDVVQAQLLENLLLASGRAPAISGRAFPRRI